MTDQNFKVVHDDKPNHYKSKTFLEFNKTKKISYEGQLKDGVPHGWGIFTSMWHYGEVLNGYWSDGQPIGPFSSREYQTGHTFRNVRIGLVTTTNTFTENTLARSVEKFHYGVASVECNVSGKFFSDFPKAKLLFSNPFPAIRLMEHLFDKPKDGTITNVLHVIQNLKPDLEQPCNGPTIQSVHRELIVRYTPSSGFKVDGFKPNNDENRKKLSFVVDDQFPGMFNIKGWEPTSVETEALIFVPGFNSNPKSALEALGQLICLGNLSTEIKPFVFQWPGGSLVQFMQAVNMAESETTRRDFIEMLGELAKSGISKIHIVAHSMGGRVVLNAASDFHEIFNAIGETDDDAFSLGDGKIELGSLTLLNPEASLPAFLDHSYKHAATYTSIITLYGNRKDLALTSAEYLNWDHMLGLRVNSLYYDVDGERRYLDMDVIDSSDLDVNVHGAKHVYFNLNQYIVDDLCDIITNERRAAKRDYRLLPINGNVFGILSAPSYITN